MDAQQRDLFRKAILRTLDANRTRFGLNVVQLAFHLSVFGFTVRNFGSMEEFHAGLKDELQYLEDKKLIEEVNKFMTREIHAWRIAEAGIAFVDQNP